MVEESAIQGAAVEVGQEEVVVEVQGDIHRDEEQEDQGVEEAGQ